MKQYISRHSEIAAYKTKDSSLIRELIHPASHAAQSQSLAEATVEPGKTTELHRHHQTEEIYHVTGGCGRMQLGQQIIELGIGDSVVIAPGTAHRISNIGQTPLIFLCACSPAYSHEDTEILCRS